MKVCMRKLNPRLALEKKEQMRCSSLVLGLGLRWGSCVTKGREAKRQEPWV